MKDDERPPGQSRRVRCRKNIVETGTNVTIAGYRYSTRGLIPSRRVWIATLMTAYTSRSLRNRTNLTVNQSTGKGLGSLSISGVD